MHVVKALAASLVTALATSGGGVAADDTLTGDWGGERERLERSGIVFAGAFKADLFDMDGGLQDDKAAMYHTELGIEFDLDALFGASGWSAFLNVIDDRGDTLNEDSLASLLGASNLEVYPDATRIDHAWVQKSSEDGGLSLLIGLYPVDSEFAAIDSGGMFSNPAFGPPADLSLTDTPSIFPTSAFGVRLLMNSADESRYMMIAVLDGVAGDPDDAKKTTIKFDSDEGAFGIAEVGFLQTREDEGPSKLALGLWGYSEDGDKIRPVMDGEAVAQGARWGGYVLGDQRAWADGERSIDTFARYSISDGDTNPLQSAFSIGVLLNGFLSGRPDDVLGLAYTRGDLSSDFEDLMESDGIKPSSHEDAWELAYRVQLTGWLVVQPMVQWVSNPGADSAVDDATIVGARVEITF